MATDQNISNDALNDDNGTKSFERILLNIPECFVYQIPPMRSANGYRAEEWNLANPLLTGFLRVFQRESFVRIVIYRYVDPSSRSTSQENLLEFAQCPIEIKPKEGITGVVDEVYDSSRYFVLRIQDPKSSRTLYLGIGFTERETAFDFRCCLNECFRYVDRMLLGSSLQDESAEDALEEGKITVSSIVKSLAIQDGTKIKIPTKGIISKNKPANDDSSTESKLRPSSKGMLLPPRQALTVTNHVGEGSDCLEEEEWSDFT